MGYQVKVVASSVFPLTGDVLTTMEIVVPGTMLEYIYKHRMFSCTNTSEYMLSAREILESIRDNPYVPTFRELKSVDSGLAVAQKQWLELRDAAARQASEYITTGLDHYAKALLRPFSWQTVVVTATEWEHFFALRHNDKLTEIQVIAQLMYQAHSEGQPQIINSGEWHLPYIEFEELGVDQVQKISVARCAHPGERSSQDNIEIYEQLLKIGHFTPLEHVATPDTRIFYRLQDYARILHDDWSFRQSHGNFRGWRQLRKFVIADDDDH